MLRCVSRPIAIGLLGVFLTQMGTLSNVAVLFRSAKPLALFFTIACWYLAEKLTKYHFRWSIYFLLLCYLLTSFLFDESTLLTYVFVAGIMTRFMLKRPLLAALYLLPLIGYLLMAFKLFPWVSTMLGFTAVGQKQAELMSFTNYLNLRTLFSFDTVRLFALNAWVLLKESLFLHNPASMGTSTGSAVIVIHLLVSALLLALIIRHVFIVSKREGWKMIYRANSQISFISICIIAAIIFHGLMMCLAPNGVWGPFYYGAYFGVLLVLLTAEVSRISGLFRNMTYLWMASLIAASIVSFPAMNNVYKQFHYYPYQPQIIVDCFLGKLNRFELIPLPSFSKSAISSLAAHQWTTEAGAVRIPKEALWVLIENGKFGDPEGFRNTELAQSWNVTEYDVYRDAFQPASLMREY
jgi:hypothetical protein